MEFKRREYNTGIESGLNIEQRKNSWFSLCRPKAWKCYVGSPTWWKSIAPQHQKFFKGK